MRIYNIIYCFGTNRLRVWQSYGCPTRIYVYVYRWLSGEIYRKKCNRRRDRQGFRAPFVRVPDNHLHAGPRQQNNEYDDDDDQCCAHIYIWIYLRPRLCVYSYLFNINWLPCSREIEPDKMDRSQILNTFDVAKRIGERAPTRYYYTLYIIIYIYTYIYCKRRWRRHYERDDADLVSPAYIMYIYVCLYMCVCVCVS